MIVGRETTVVPEDRSATEVLTISSVVEKGVTLSDFICAPGMKARAPS